MGGKPRLLYLGDCYGPDITAVFYAISAPEKINKDIDMKKAFTLIELLVVVLIIGILAAVALPQYRVAVSKTKTTQYMICTNALVRALQEYHLANNAWPADGSDISEIAETSLSFYYWVNRRDTATEAVVLICGNSQIHIEEGGNKITRFCRAHKDDAITKQACKSLTGSSIGIENGDYLIYQF